MTVSGIKFTKLAEGILRILKMAETYTSRLPHTIGTCTSPQWSPVDAAGRALCRRRPGRPGSGGPGGYPGVALGQITAAAYPSPKVTRRSDFGSAAAGPRGLRTQTHRPRIRGPVTRPWDLGAQAAAALRQTPRSYPAVGLG
jgi:hypothetical protein